MLNIVYRCYMTVTQYRCTGTPFDSASVTMLALQLYCNITFIMLADLSCKGDRFKAYLVLFEELTNAATGHRLLLLFWICIVNKPF